MSSVRWKVPLECRHCGSSGEVVFSKPVSSGAPPDVVYLPGGFNVVPSRRVDKTPNVLCLRCGKSAMPHAATPGRFFRRIAGALPHFH
jgi:hypothetical protein